MEPQTCGEVYTGSKHICLSRVISVKPIGIPLFLLKRELEPGETGSSVKCLAHHHEDPLSEVIQNPC